jgi:hypothetical protein
MATATRIWESWKVIGFNCQSPSPSHSTAPSGTWFALGVDGAVWCWHPVNRLGIASQGAAGYFDGLPVWQDNAFSGPSGISDVRGAVVAGAYWQAQAQSTGPGLVLSIFRMNALQGQNWAQQFFFGARKSRI